MREDSTWAKDIKNWSTCIPQGWNWIHEKIYGKLIHIHKYNIYLRRNCNTLSTLKFGSYTSNNFRLDKVLNFRQGLLSLKNETKSTRVNLPVILTLLSFVFHMTPATRTMEIMSFRMFPYHKREQVAVLLLRLMILMQVRYVSLL